jgi:hypothetical protein
MHQQLWGYKVEEKLYLGVREQKRQNTTDLPDTTRYYTLHSDQKAVAAKPYISSVAQKVTLLLRLKWIASHVHRRNTLQVKSAVKRLTRFNAISQAARSNLAWGLVLNAPIGFASPLN